MTQYGAILLAVTTTLAFASNSVIDQNSWSASPSALSPATSNAVFDPQQPISRTNNPFLVPQQLPVSQDTLQDVVMGPKTLFTAANALFGGSNPNDKTEFHAPTHFKLPQQFMPAQTALDTDDKTSGIIPASWAQHIPNGLSLSHRLKVKLVKLRTEYPLMAVAARIMAAMNIALAVIMFHAGVFPIMAFFLVLSGIFAVGGFGVFKQHVHDREFLAANGVEVNDYVDLAALSKSIRGRQRDAKMSDAVDVDEQGKPLKGLKKWWVRKKKEVFGENAFPTMNTFQQQQDAQQVSLQQQQILGQTLPSKRILLEQAESLNTHKSTSSSNDMDGVKPSANTFSSINTPDASNRENSEKTGSFDDAIPAKIADDTLGTKALQESIKALQEELKKATAAAAILPFMRSVSTSSEDKRESMKGKKRNSSKKNTEIDPTCTPQGRTTLLGVVKSHLHDYHVLMSAYIRKFSVKIHAFLDKLRAKLPPRMVEWWQRVKAKLRDMKKKTKAKIVGWLGGRMEEDWEKVLRDKSKGKSAEEKVRKEFEQLCIRGGGVVVPDPETSLEDDVSDDKDESSV